MNQLKNAFKNVSIYLRGKGFQDAPLGIVLGTGMGSVLDIISIEKEIPFKDIPNFPASNVKFQKGSLIYGSIGGKKVICMNGRYHYYEGHSMRDVAFPVYVLHKMGVRHLLITSAVGGINRNYKKGDLVLVKDHINLCSANPLVGLRDEDCNVIFPNMVDAYDKETIRILKTAANKKGIKLKEGVLAYLPGPNFETIAELRFLSSLGADMIGWSMVPEVLMSRALNIKTTGICCISDISNPKTVVPANLDDIVDVCMKASHKLSVLIKDFVKKTKGGDN